MPNTTTNHAIAYTNETVNLSFSLLSDQCLSIGKQSRINPFSCKFVFLAYLGTLPHGGFGNKMASFKVGGYFGAVEVCGLVTGRPRFLE